MSCDEVFLVDETEISLLIQEGIPGPPGPPGPVGINWLGAWASGTAYVVDDAVDKDGSSYICILAHTNHAPPNATYWDVIALKGTDGSAGTPGPAGMNWLGAWASGTAYVVDDAVEKDGSSYICILGHTNHAPPNATYWDLVAERGTDGTGGGTGPSGLNWLGAWASGTAYVVDDAVESGGSAYVCILGHTNHVPPNATYWDLLAAGGGMTNPMTTVDDLIVGDTGGTPLRLGLGGVGTFLGVDVNNKLGYYYPQSDLAVYNDPTLLFAFSWINQGGASMLTTRSGIAVSAPPVSGDQLRILKYAAPATPYTITAFFRATLLTDDAHMAGICWREGSSGKLVVANINAAGSGGLVYVYADKYTDETTFTGTYAFKQILPAAVYGFRITDNGTNRIVEFTTDGVGWHQLHSISRTNFMTADQVGFCVNANSSTYKTTMHLLSWEES